MVEEVFTTDFGKSYKGNIEEVLKTKEFEQYKGRIDLILTSPPFPLNRKKKYGTWLKKNI